MTMCETDCTRAMRCYCNVEIGELALALCVLYLIVIQFNPDRAAILFVVIAARQQHTGHTHSNFDA